MSDEKILKRIQAMKNLAEDMGTTEHERIVAFGKMQQLMKQWSVSELDLQGVDMTHEKPDVFEVDIYIRGASGQYKNGFNVLFQAIAKANGCHALSLHNHRQTLVCLPSQKELLVYFYQVAAESIIRAKKVEWKKIKNNTYDTAATFSTGFIRGAISAYADKLRELQKETKTTDEQKEGLIKVENATLALFNEKFPRTRTAGQRGISKNGYDSGNEFGKALQVNKGLTGVRRLTG